MRWITRGPTHWAEIHRNDYARAYTPDRNPPQRLRGQEAARFEHLSDRELRSDWKGAQ